MPRKPPPLRPRDVVALVSPSGACDPERLALGVALLESWGLRVELCLSDAPVRYMASSDDCRARGIVDAFARDDVRALLSVRGGYGAARLYRRLDLRAAARSPKLFIGFSDVTILLNRLVQEADLAAYHGPMVAADLPRISERGRERFRRFLFGEDGWWDGSVRDVWRAGTSEGRLVGGCLSILVTTLGTPYEIDTDGAVVFVEDVAEKPYRIDRMLGHMRDAGKFERVQALVLGPLLDCDGGEGPSVLREIFLDVLGETSFPILYGIDAGHGTDNVVLPFGCNVRVDGARGHVDLLERVLA